MINKVRLDAMLSSTSKDLPQHRENASHAAKRAGFYVIQMEDLGARAGEDALSVSLAMVEEAEVYVGIFGHRYGYRPEDLARNPDDLSVTELEYRHAVKLGMPILVFIMDESHPAPDSTGKPALEAKKLYDDFFEADPIGKQKLDTFKKKLMNENIVAFFKSADDLKDSVLQALMNPDLKEKARAYHQKRADEGAPSAAAKPAQAAQIAPPILYAMPPYSGHAQKFVGRADDLNMLDLWWDDTSSQPMFVLEAIGGMGKSALTWKWMQDRVTRFEGVFWYSFYEGGADMLDCLRHAHAYFTCTPLEQSRGMTRAALMPELLHALKQKRHLMMLDGMERILVAYHRWDSAQMQDESVEGDREHRACIEPQDEDTLRQLLGCAPSRILITSRLMPDALQEFGRPLDAVRHHGLRGLSHEDAKRLWREAGITWHDEAQLDRFLYDIGGHSLLLKLVAGAITKSRRPNFDRWYTQQNGAVNFATLDLKAKRHHILEAAYDGLSDEARQVLSTMAAFGEPVDIDILSGFNPYILSRPEEVPNPKDLSPLDILEAILSDKPVPTPEQYEAYLEALEAYHKQSSPEYAQALSRMDQLLTELESRGLLWWDNASGRYDLHPVVRGYAFSQLDEYRRQQTYAQVANFFEGQERGFDGDNARTLQDFQPIINLYKALVGAGRLDDAAKLYGQFLEIPLYSNAVSYTKAYELLLPLFGDGLNHPPTLLDESQRYYRLGSMSSILNALKRHKEALKLNEIELTLVLSQKDINSLWYSLNGYAISLLYLNQLYDSTQIRLLLKHVAEEAESPEWLANAYRRLLYLYSALGKWKEVDSAYKAYLNMVQQPISDNFALAETLCHYAQSLFSRGANTDIALKDAERACRESRNLMAWRDVIFTQGEIALIKGHTGEARDLFSAVIKSANESGVRDKSYWGGLARAYLALGDRLNAARIVQDFCDDYSAAVVLHAIGEPDEARTRALAYYEWAWADGEPYVNRYDLERARALLATLGVEEPSLPVKPHELHPLIGQVEAWLERWHKDQATFDEDES